MHAYYLSMLEQIYLTINECLVTSHSGFYLFQKCESLKLLYHSNYVNNLETIDIPCVLAKLEHYHKFFSDMAQHFLFLPLLTITNQGQLLIRMIQLASNQLAFLSSNLSSTNMFCLNQKQLLSVLLYLVLYRQMWETIKHYIYEIIHRFSCHLFLRNLHFLLHKSM